MIKCTRCGFELSDDSTFCNRCGLKILEEEVTVNNKVENSEAIAERIRLNKLERARKKAEEKRKMTHSILIGILSPIIIILLIIVIINLSSSVPENKDFHEKEIKDYTNEDMNNFIEWREEEQSKNKSSDSFIENFND